MSPLSSDAELRERQLANLTPAPPIQAGEQRALSHGGYADIAAARLDAKTRAIYDALSADAPLRAADGGLPAHDAAIVSVLAIAMCHLEDVNAHLTQYGLFVRRRPRPAVELASRLRKEIVSYLEQLGMTPKARANLGVDLARAASTLGDELDAARRAREQREANPREANQGSDVESTAVEDVEIVAEDGA